MDKMFYFSWVYIPRIGIAGSYGVLGVTSFSYFLLVL